MFRSLRSDTSSAFDSFIQGLLTAGAAAFVVSVVLLLAGLGADSTAPELAQGTVTVDVVSVQALLPDLGGSIMQIPSFRL